jgi:hypothetical protein
MAQGLSARKPVVLHSYFHTVISIESNILSTIHFTHFLPHIHSHAADLFANQQGAGRRGPLLPVLARSRQPRRSFIILRQWMTTRSPPTAYVTYKTPQGNVGQQECKGALSGFSKYVPREFEYLCGLGKSRGSAVGIATCYGLYDWKVGVRVPVGSSIFTSPYRPDQLWDPPSLLSNG